MTGVLLARILQTATAQVLKLTRHPIVDLSLRRHRPTARGVGLLAAYKAPLIEAAPEVLRRFELVIQIRHQPGAKSFA